MPKSFILYSSLTQLTARHHTVFAGMPSIGNPRIYVRAELVDCDHNEAMDRVKPMEGETFLNCVPAGGR